MADALIAVRLLRRLENFTTLSEQERTVVNQAIGPPRDLAAHEDLIREGEVVSAAHIILTGFACRQKMLPDGRRQIIGYLLPGDICDARVCMNQRMDHTISTVSPAKVAVVSRDAIFDSSGRYPGLMHALCWVSLAEESIMREWLLNVGQRTALERLAHLFCEIFVRLRSVGLADGDSCELPVTQAQLADTLALSTVHINRTLRELRHANLISIRAKSLIIHDFESLKRIAMFDPSYLHLDGDRMVARPARSPSMA
jgi:CRP-like cAMP-binding protein